MVHYTGCGHNHGDGSKDYIFLILIQHVIPYITILRLTRNAWLNMLLKCQIIGFLICIKFVSMAMAMAVAMVIAMAAKEKKSKMLSFAAKEKKKVSSAGDSRI